MESTISDKVPTHQEISQLTESDALYQTNLFRLQMEELIKEVTIPTSKCKYVEEFLRELRSALQSVKYTKTIELSKAGTTFKTMVWPLPPFPAQVKGKFRFSPVTTVTVVGSYLLGTLCKPKLVIDLAVQISQDFIHERDCLNYRYYTKRCLFLMVLALSLRKNPSVGGVQFSQLSGNPWKPTLLITPAGKAGKRFRVNVLPTLAAESTIPLKKLAPLVNNVRPVWCVSREDLPLLPTPVYNKGIAEDIMMDTHLHDLHLAFSRCPAMKEAVILLKVWLRQRGLDEGFGGINGTVISMLSAFLLSIKKISRNMGAYQILRAVFSHLASPAASEGMSLCNEPSKPGLVEFTTTSAHVLVDSSGMVNFLAGTSTSTFSWLCQESRKALEMLDNIKGDSFHALFIRPVKFSLAFDQHLRFPLDKVARVCKQKKELLPDFIDDGMFPDRVVSEYIQSTLCRALGKRATLVVAGVAPVKPWSLKQSPPTSRETLVFGLRLSDDFHVSVMEKGPSANDAEAKDFQEFWGEKSQLRRFKDSTVLETVLWDVVEVWDRYAICGQIVRHVSKRWFGLTDNDVGCFGSQLDKLLVPAVEHPDGSKVLNLEDRHLRVVLTLDDLNQQLMKLDNLPLGIVNIRGFSSSLKLTETFPPLLCQKMKNSARIGEVDGVVLPMVSFPVHRVAIQFEASGKWPDDLVAIQHCKAALLAKLASEINSQLGLLATTSGSFTDVLKDGYVFRLEVFYPREIHLLKQYEEAACLPSHPLVATHSELHLKFVMKTAHTTLIHSFTQRYTSYSLVTRLFKRWLASQLLSGFFSDEVVELLVAWTLLCPDPYPIPKTLLSGFRRVLHALSDDTFSKTLLVINVDGNINDLQIEECSKMYESQRCNLPPVCILTPYDSTLRTWTSPEPSSKMLKRAGVLAGAALDILDKQESKPSTEPVIDIKMLFRPSLKDFDLLIHLSEDWSAVHYQAVDSTVAIKESKDEGRHKVVQSMPLVDFNPPELYIRELTACFGNIAEFFHDRYGGRVIGVMWKSVDWNCPFGASKVPHRIPLMTEVLGPESGLLCLDILGIIEDFRRLGEGLVTDIRIGRC